ncbi:MAG: hypothetical protein V4689_11300 [Verrucomicrobiota bacterium]
MTVQQFAATGTLLFCLGILMVTGAIALYVMTRTGIFLQPRADLQLHDTYYIVFPRGSRLIFLLPLLAGFAMIASGVLIKTHLRTLDDAVKKAQQMEL